VFAVKHLAGDAWHHGKTALMLEGLGEGRFKVKSTFFDKKNARTAGETVLIRDRQG
jgi:hypothetical protein